MRPGRFDKASQCMGKEAYCSAKMAYQVAERRSSRQMHITAYRCAHCGLWHNAEAIPRLAKPQPPAPSLNDWAEV